MHYILYVQLQNFYLRGFDPEAMRSLSKPLLIVRDKSVIGMNRAASDRKIWIGMSYEHATALAPHAEVHHWKAEGYVKHQEEWLDICAQYSGVIEPEDQHSAFIDLTLHPAPANVAIQLTEELAKNGLPAQAGIAPSKWVAKLTSAESRLEIVDAREFLGELPIDQLTPVDPEHRLRLKFFGYRTIGEVAGIPLATLKRQFDKDALSIRLAARGRLQDTVKPLYPKDAFVDSLLFDSPVESLESFDEALVSLSKRLGKRLRENDLFGAELHVQVEFEEAAKKLQRRFAKPITCPLSLRSALRLLLQGEITKPVSAIRIQLPKLQRTRSSQADLMGKSEKARSIDSALQNLRTAFGDNAVQSASDVRLPRRMQVLKEWKDALGWR
jgi:DNA polymerase IV